ncbi:MAG: DNA circularization N-terminal domain-containing protein [Hylemonella sp.]|nr:DNA circularization N-terminal domain-containing protein [Hylemonella sp.]MDP1938081.1 DNA circularization N-terminal domain-containing protein [Hylemonella sp.]
MSWFDELQQATFRGIPFSVEGAESSYGRRAVVHEYPLRDRPFVEDLGRKARTFTLEAYVWGPFYMQARDALMSALEQGGSGRLVHPYLGERTVTVTDFKKRESTSEGGMVRFTINCVEAGDLAFPSVQDDTARQVDQAADNALLEAQARFAAVFIIDALPEFVAAAAQGRLGAAIDLIQKVSASLPTLPGIAATFGPQLLGVRSELSSLMQGPSALGGALVGLVSGLSGLLSLPSDALTMLRGLFTFGDTTVAVPATTPSRVQQGINQAAIHSLIQQAAVIEATRSSSQMTFGGYTDAIAVRDELATRLDTLAETTPSDTVYQSLVTLRTAMIRDITARGADLARTVTVQPQATQPALVLAYALYEDASRDADIIARNNVRHPGFVPGGRTLEVLADA